MSFKNSSNSMKTSNVAIDFLQTKIGFSMLKTMIDIVLTINIHFSLTEI